MPNVHAHSGPNACTDGDRFPDGDARLGFYRFDVDEEGIRDIFIPLEKESAAEGAYGPGGHPRPEERDYSLAQEQ